MNTAANTAFDRTVTLRALTLRPGDECEGCDEYDAERDAALSAGLPGDDDANALCAPADSPASVVSVEDELPY